MPPHHPTAPWGKTDERILMRGEEQCANPVSAAPLLRLSLSANVTSLDEDIELS